jgi:microcystin-dependent protein
MATPYLGQLALFPWGIIPKGWAQCQGQLLPIAQNQALFSLLGTTYGGDGRTTFGLPDLRGRTPVSAGSGIVLGQKGGEETHQLSTQEVPTHNHQINATTNTVNSPSAANNVLGQTVSGAAVYKQNPTNVNAPLDTSTVGPYGGNQPHENRTPFVAMNWCIAMAGIFPSRN